MFGRFGSSQIGVVSLFMDRGHDITSSVTCFLARASPIHVVMGEVQPVASSKLCLGYSEQNPERDE